jgi:hypothetical protein
MPSGSRHQVAAWWRNQQAGDTEFTECTQSRTEPRSAFLAFAKGIVRPARPIRGATIGPNLKSTQRITPRET